MAQKILVIDDEEAIRRTLNQILTYEGFLLTEASNGLEGLRLIRENEYDCVICDIKMPRMDGIELLTAARGIKPDIPFIIISGHGNIDTAVEAVKKGAFDYIAKPADLNRVLITIRNAMDKSRLVDETKYLRSRLGRRSSAVMIGKSPAILKVKETIAKVAFTDARVLITGENGVGKELVARSLHDQSARAAGPMIELNCAAIPTELIESELFGHEKGAFTSAVKQRIGKFEQASGGTLFLDEIGDMSLSAQAKMLRALQEGKITRVGGERDVKVDVRIVAATNKDLLEEVEAKKFRLDLYHRLGVILIKVPSLNERIEDIPELTWHFLKQICEEHGQPLKQIEPEALTAMQHYNWTGNIRELRNAVERLVILSDKEITEKDVTSYVFMK